MSEHILRVEIEVCIFGNRSKSADKKPPGQKPPEQKPPGLKPPDNKLPRIIAKYAVDANLYRLGSNNPKKKIRPLVFFWLLYRGLIVVGLLSGGFL